MKNRYFDDIPVKRFGEYVNSYILFAPYKRKIKTVNTRYWHKFEGDMYDCEDVLDAFNNKFVHDNEFEKIINNISGVSSWQYR